MFERLMLMGDSSSSQRPNRPEKCKHRIQGVSHRLELGKGSLLLSWAWSMPPKNGNHWLKAAREEDSLCNCARDELTNVQERHEVSAKYLQRRVRLSFCRLLVPKSCWAGYHKFDKVVPPSVHVGCPSPAWAWLIPPRKKLPWEIACAA
jgi:hypothetical protein